MKPRRPTEVTDPRIIAPEDFAADLIAKLESGTATVEEMDEMVDLLAITGTTLTGEVPERIRQLTRH
jgi:hypothetical protein